MTKNLWGTIATDEVPRTPVHVLKEQASLIGPATDNLVEGRASVQAHDGKFHARLRLVVPVLDNYSYTLVSVSYGHNIYPCFLTNEVQEIGIECEDEAEFLEMLGETLSSKEIHAVIKGLISQARESEDYHPPKPGRW